MRVVPSRLHVCASLIAAAIAARKADAVPLLDGFGGPVGYGTDFLPGNDDGSTSAIDLSGAFPGGLLFFGGPYTTVYVNNNGNITFNGPVFEYTPIAFPIASQPMIAPYWGDVDTRGGGYPTSNGVFWAFLPGQMIVTWHNVGYYSIHDDLKMNFQLILTNAVSCGVGDFDVEFRFDRCEWTTGDASGGSGGFGGTPAQAGFDAGNGVDYVEIPGSRTPAIIDLCTTSNVDEPGIWRFGVRNGVVSCPGTGEVCDTGQPGVCATGVTQCLEAGVACVPVRGEGDEVCNSLDDDCDGIVDGPGSCPEPEVCAAGVCVSPCFEDGCIIGMACNDDGLCVDPGCLGIVCDEGQRCVGGDKGTCVAACDGVVCPYGQVCLVGQCVDLCDVVVCPEDSLCVEGACVGKCPCHPCDEDEICDAEGACIPLGCDVVICDAGFYCQDGTCLDACDGAVCPYGSQCEVGDCVPAAPPGLDAGVPGAADGGLPGVVPDGEDGGEADGDGGEADGGYRGRNFYRPTCACRLGARAGASALPLLPAALLALVLRRRRRCG